MIYSLNNNLVVLIEAAASKISNVTVISINGSPLCLVSTSQIAFSDSPVVNVDYVAGSHFSLSVHSDLLISIRIWLL